MSNFIIEIQAPALVSALEQLAAAMVGRTGPEQPANPAPAQFAPTPAPAPALAAPHTIPTAPPVPIAPPAPAPAAAPAVIPPVTPAPVAAAPGYQLDDLARAAAQLMDAGKQQDLLGLLSQFGVPSLAQLPQAQYGNFALALKQMGAKL